MAPDPRHEIAAARMAWKDFGSLKPTRGAVVEAKYAVIGGNCSIRANSDRGIMVASAS